MEIILITSHHVSQTTKHGGDAIYVWGCINSRGMGYMCNIDREDDTSFVFSILEDGVMKTIEWHHFNSSRIVFQHDNDPNLLQHRSSIGCQCKRKLMYLLGLPNHLP